VGLGRFLGAIAPLERNPCIARGYK
jgi:hypothetical protein